MRIRSLEKPITSRLTDRGPWEILAEISYLPSTLAGAGLCPRRVCRTWAWSRISAFAPSCFAEVPPGAPVHSHCEWGVRGRRSEKIAETKGCTGMCPQSQCPAQGLRFDRVKPPRCCWCPVRSCAHKAQHQHFLFSGAQGPVPKLHLLKGQHNRLMFYWKWLNPPWQWEMAKSGLKLTLHKTKEQ